jgi:mannose-6-phosphate isomerase-like protein (cupin superfamily)
MSNAWEPKCWGEVWHLFASDHAAVSHLKLNAGFQCSRHYHEHRVNQFAVLSGKIAVDEWFGDEVRTIELTPGRFHTVYSLVIHRFRVLESGEIVEVYYPDNDGQVRINDIVRLDEGGPIESVC